MSFEEQFTTDDLKALKKLSQAFRAESVVRKVASAKNKIAKSKIAPTNNTSSPESHTLISDEVSLRTFLFNKCPALRLLKCSDNLIFLAAPKVPILPKLPQGYGYKGGAARLALGVALRMTTTDVKPRDLDIVRLGPARAGEDLSVAQQFMPNDLKYGHGVERIDSLEQYFETRDLGINEILLIDNRLILSWRALNDFLLGRIALSRHLLRDADNIPGNIVAKMVRLKAEFAKQRVNAEVILPVKVRGLTSFEYNLHLKRAKEIDSQVANDYTYICNELGLWKERAL